MVKIKIIFLHPADNVATVLEKVEEWTEVQIEKSPNNIQIVRAITKIPFLHKIAVKDITEGSPVIKYGQIIGKASQNIKEGEHVHTRNLKSWFY
jgi:altronate dehydratase small subunit